MVITSYLDWNSKHFGSTQLGTVPYARELRYDMGRTIWCDRTGDAVSVAHCGDTLVILYSVHSSDRTITN